MSDYELAQMLNVTVSEANDFIQRCDRFDRYMESLYDEEAVRRVGSRFDQLIESTDWGLFEDEDFDA